jgi:hypothetical protein
MGLNMAFISFASVSIVYQNWFLYKQKSTIGYSSDFALINFMGYLFLMFNQVLGLIDPYTSAGRVHTLDVLTFLIQLVASALAITQCMIYPSDRIYRVTVVTWSVLFCIWFLSGLLEGYLNYQILQSVFGIDWP